MGTLFEQSCRKYNHLFENNYFRVRSFIAEIKKVAKEENISFKDALEVVKILEYQRKTDAYIANGDAWDEQIAGIGKLFLGFGNKMDDLCESLRGEGGVADAISSCSTGGDYYDSRLSENVLKVAQAISNHE